MFLGPRFPSSGFQAWVLKVLALNTARYMPGPSLTDEEQQAATQASAEEAINIAAKSKGIAEGDTQFLMHLIKASALEEVAVNVQTAIQVKEREMKQAKK